MTRMRMTEDDNYDEPVMGPEEVQHTVRVAVGVELFLPALNFGIAFGFARTS